jgi:glyoxylate reductase
MSKVFVSRLIPERGLKKVKAATDTEVWNSDLPPPADVLLDKAKDCDGLLSLLTDKIDGDFMDACPRLKVIANLAVGFDNIDIPAATERGVIVGNTPGVLTDTTTDFAWTLLMAAARRLTEGERYVREGKWKTWGPLLLRGQDIHHATLGLVGLGRIGSEMARRAQGFSMEVLYHDIFRREDLEQSMGIRYVDMDTLLSESDFVSVHVPLFKETYHLIDDAAFAKMKNSAVLVNSARGPIVDPKALYDALSSGQIFAAGLDVTEPEPIEMDDPLLTLENCVIAPHIASGSVETREQMSDVAAENILAGLAGKQGPAIVNPEVFEKGLRQ